MSRWHRTIIVRDCSARNETVTAGNGVWYQFLEEFPFGDPTREKSPPCGFVERFETEIMYMIL